jgi:hypothetical protein
MGICDHPMFVSDPTNNNNKINYEQMKIIKQQQTFVFILANLAVVNGSTPCTDGKCPPIVV